MDEYEKYLFDLNGYLVVRNALSAERLAELNAALAGVGIDDLLRRVGYVHTGFPEGIEGNQDPASGPIDVEMGSMLDWGTPFRDLVDEPAIKPYLVELLQDGYRLDHAYSIFMRSGWRDDVAHSLHGGATPFDPSQSYRFEAGRMFNGLTVVSFTLSDVPEGAGGFCVIPGSHKANYPLPDRIKAAKYEWPVRQVALNAGDAVIFTEAITHGAMPWRAEHDRRALLLKYAPGFMQWEKGSPWTKADDRFTPAQRDLLRGPFATGR